MAEIYDGEGRLFFVAVPTRSQVNTYLLFNIRKKRCLVCLIRRSEKLFLSHFRLLLDKDLLQIPLKMYFSICYHLHRK